MVSAQGDDYYTGEFIDYIQSSPFLNCYKNNTETRKWKKEKKKVVQQTDKSIMKENQNTTTMKKKQ